MKNFEQAINLRASALAREFIATLNETEKADDKLSYQKVYLTLKFSETPDSILVEGMKLRGNSDETRRYFKNLAKMVHPDKNGHPLAKSVFQKPS